MLEVKNLVTEFVSGKSAIRAVDGVSFRAKKGQILGIVGESGCGKSVTALSMMRLLPKGAGRIAGGSVLFDGTDLTRLAESEMQKIRGNRMAMVFQEPMTALNPVYTIGYQIEEVLALHLGLRKQEAGERIAQLLDQVGIYNPRKIMEAYPHQLSGGMRQRVMIAMALACSPQLLIADEPTTALDVTIQAQVLELIRKISDDMHSTIILITHDLGVIAEMAQAVLVMYAGRCVEEAPVERLFKEPLHPYTIGLMRSRVSRRQRGEKLVCIPGMIPTPDRHPRGCTFAPRCHRAEARCAQAEPQLVEVEPGRKVACFYPGGEPT